MPESVAEQGRVSGTAAGGETITASAGAMSLSGEGGGDVLIGNAGDNRFWTTDLRDRIVEQPGGGTDTLIAYSPTKLAANVENLQVNGAYNYAVGNELGNLIVVDNESHWIHGAGGDDVLAGGTGRSTFMVRAGEGSDVIYNWGTNSQLQLQGYGLTTAAQIRGAMTQQGQDVLLNLGGGETLTFRGVGMSAFTDRQFLTPLDTSKLGALTFSDEFNTLQVYDHSLQTGLWRADFGGNLKDQWAYTLVSNGERQAYVQPGFQGRGEADLDINPFAISGGVLTITAKPIPEAQGYAAWNREFSSGMLNTLGMFEQKHGYFEIRAELPTAVGAWPAFWMIPTKPDGSVEGDIMEALALTPNYHYARALGGADTMYDNSYKADPSGFHTYGMLWTPQTVTFYYDGIATLTGKTPANWAEPMAMIVNMAVGGWGGEPNTAMFPTQMKVDYVRAYALADGSTIVERGTPETPVATLLAQGGLTSGQVNMPVVFADSGQAVTDGKIAVFAAKPAALPPGKTFVIWEDAGAVFGAVSNGQSLATPTVLMAGSASQFTGTGTWLTNGKVAFGYMMPDGAGKAAWSMVFDPVKLTFTRQELGPSVGDIDFVATKAGGFAVSWDGLDGRAMGRAYDDVAYGGDIPGWYGPTRVLAGDLVGVTASGDVIASGPGGQQLYGIANASAGPWAGPTPGNDVLQAVPGHTEIHAGAGNDTVNGSAGQDYLRGDEGNDRLVGGDAFDDVHGNMGDDTAYGGLGDDWVVGGKDQDLLYGEEGSDIVYGNLGADTVDGGVGADIVRGGQGDDLVLGSWGDDWIAGDRGSDTITGGGGADIFHTWTDAGLDRVTDFNRTDGDRVNILPGSSYTVAQVGADTVIDLGAGQMVLVGVSMSSLTPGWIFTA
jgi:beta-glucanase (GH16 family)